VQAFIHCRLDYCNAVLARTADIQIKRLQSIQNTAARLVSGASRRGHISALLRILQWCPIRQRIVFNTAALVWRFAVSIQPPHVYRNCFYPITRKSVRERPLLWSASTCYITCLQYRNQYTGSLIDLMVWRPCPIMSAFPTIR